MKVIGITGGIGSGKSLVANIMKEKYGSLILNTDRIAKEQLKVGEASYRGVVEFFGKEILAEDKSIIRNKLAEIVFHDKNKLLKLNKITHPPVLAEVQKEIQRVRKEGRVPYLIIETALMIEAGFDFICDEVWYVYSSEMDRRSRLKKERNYTDERINSVFESQSKEEEFRQRFTKVIENIGDVVALEEQVEYFIKLLMT